MTRTRSLTSDKSTWTRRRRLLAEVRARRYHAGMTTPEPQLSAPGWAASAPPSAKPPVKVLDLVITIVLLVADAVLATLASFMGIFLVMASDSCGVRDCNVDLITLGWLMGMILPWVMLVATVVVAIVLMVKRRLAFWVPLAGAALIVLSLVAAFLVASAAVPGSTL
ncbi:DUF6264 family protein [Microbacterium sp. NPDC056044]|uniref:DUF6264 family protein n=1 Tax=Microbacterium sp. NPDC056044 TaxID=3345690 RepID=UPI0035DFFB6C